MKSIFLPIVLLVLSSVSLFSNDLKKERNNNVIEASYFLNDVVTADSFQVQVSDCTADGEVCIDIPFNDIGNYSFTIDGVLYSGGFSECLETSTNFFDYSQLFGQGNLGPYSLDSWDVNGTVFTGQFQNIPELVDSMNVWDPTGNWVANTTDQTITGGNPTSVYTTMFCTVINISAPTSIPLFSDTVADGATLSLPVGTHQVQLQEFGGTMCLDSFVVEVICVGTTVENIEIDQDSTFIFCFDNSDLQGNVVSTEIFCPDDPATIASFTLINSNTCVEILGISEGVDTACYVICDDIGICDTTTLHVTVNATNPTVQWVFDTVFVNTSERTCIDTSGLSGAVVGISNNCPDQSGEYALFSIDASEFCVDYFGVDIGKDTACIHLIDQNGNVDTTYIVACVSNPIPDTIYQDILVGNSASFCIDTTQLGGVITPITEICTSNANVTVTATTPPNCYEVLANTAGQDTVCYEFCDNFGLCDTAVYIFNVMDTPGGSLVANDDSHSVVVGEVWTFNVCDNDSIPDGILESSTILPMTEGGVGPNNGTVNFDSECVVSYAPIGTECGYEDSFNYVICNASECDTALVTISVLCQGSLEFTNGFSPNGDEVNQFFTIKGAEDFPNNSLQVFNRWGNQVYKANGYQNDWDGRWQGLTLQNGTYFYVFNDGVGNTFSGYVLIQQ
ncbi:MAG: gliding motility-associated C-terminal domain-containing protein [Bacteroidota bacterium]